MDALSGSETPQVVEPTQVWLQEEWELLDYRDFPPGGVRTELKTMMFRRLYGG